MVYVGKTQDVKSLFMNINELNKYHRNPRKITSKQHDLLEQTMQEFGDLSGVVFNKTTGEVVGGNQRTSIFKKYADKVKIEKTEQPKDAQGTIAIGYIDFNGSKFSYREVEWDTEKEARANIIANKVGGFWDNDILANEFDDDLLLSAGFEEFELGISGMEQTIGNKEITLDDSFNDTDNDVLHPNNNIKRHITCPACNHEFQL